MISAIIAFVVVPVIVSGLVVIIKIIEYRSTP